MNQDQLNNLANLSSSRNKKDDEKGFAEKNIGRAGTGAKVAGTSVNAAGKGMQAAGKGTQLAGKGMQGVGKGMDFAGNAMGNAGKSLSSSGYGAIIGVPLAAMGAGVKAGGKGVQVAGKGTEAAGKGMNNLGKGVSNTGKGMKGAGKELKGLSEQMGAVRKLANLRAGNEKLKNAAKDLSTPMGIMSLMKYARPSVDWLMGVALFAAMTKDILDLVGFSLPVINEAINFCVGIVIAGALLLMGSSNNRAMVKNQVKKWLTLGGGVLCEELFGLNFLPIETLVVFVCYYLVLVERREAEKGASG